GNVTDIDGALGVELRPVVDLTDDVGAVAGLNRRRRARLDRQPVDGFKIELDAEVFLALLEDISSEHLVGNRNIIRPPDPMQRRALRKCWRSARGQNAGQAPTRGGQRTGAGKLQEAAATDGLHIPAPVGAY